MDTFLVIGNLFFVVLLVLLNGFFVVAEFTVVKVRMSQLEEKIKEGNRQARYAKELVENIDVSLSVTQLGITLVSLALGWIGEPFLAELLRPVMASIGITGVAVNTIAITTAFSLITAAHIIIGELTPKNIAIQIPLKALLIIALPLLLLQKIFYPFVWVLNHVANFVTMACGFKVSSESEKEDIHSEDEIRILMAESRKHGMIDKTEYDFVDNVFEFTEKTVREIMVPRTDMICFYVENSLQENLAIVQQQQLTRYPICRDGKDDIIGFIHIKDLLNPFYQKKQSIDFVSLARKVLFVPEAMPVSRLLKTMQHEKAHLAIVVDEYGGTAGMVTIEDLVEEIVGDIQDEFDQERPVVEKKGKRIFSVDAKLSIDDVNEILELNLDAENVGTIGGWLYSQVESPPKVGQSCSWGNNRFFVEEVLADLRITRILVELDKDLQEEHDEIFDNTMK